MGCGDAARDLFDGDFNFAVHGLGDAARDLFEAFQHGFAD